MKTFKGILAVIAIVFLASCSTPKNISYFQDAESGDGEPMHMNRTDPILIRPDDKLAILVTSRDPKISGMFNLPYVTKRIGETTDSNMSGIYSAGIVGYLVDEFGNIDFPILGILHVAGMTRHQIAKSIKDRILQEGLSKDAIVTVEYMNLMVSVTGEVNKPGRYNIDRDEYSVIDAISAAGDLTIFGKRHNVKVMRTVNGKKQTYILDLTSAKNTFESKGFFLQQNDVIYVEPNTVRARQSTLNGNAILTTSFWLSLASLATTIASTIILYYRK